MELTAKTVWENCLDYIKDNIPSQSFKTWFLPIKPLKLKDTFISIREKYPYV
ncbi:MAG: DnaA N-terminal domain-containing protein, partial [Owenweeksia sp.]